MERFPMSERTITDMDATSTASNGGQPSTDIMERASTLLHALPGDLSYERFDNVDAWLFTSRSDESKSKLLLGEVVADGWAAPGTFL